MQKDPLYCAIDVSKDKLDVDEAALALPAQLRNDQAGFRQLIKAAKKYPGAVQFVFEATGPYHLGLALALWEAQIPSCFIGIEKCPLITFRRLTVAVGTTG
jgi:transposase